MYEGEEVLMTTKHPTSNGYDLWPADPPDPEVRPVPQRLVRSAAAKLRIVLEYESYPLGDPRRYWTRMIGGVSFRSKRGIPRLS